MDEQVLFNQIKALIEKEANKDLKAENDKLKKEIQELKGILKNISHPYKADSEYKLIDLGLPSGTLWMDRNIGSSSPTDFGLYFAWGETRGYSSIGIKIKKRFRWFDYKYFSSDGYLTKYCNNSKYGYDGYNDSLVTLQSTDDAAYQFTNGECSMPTKEQIQELLDNTTYEWTTLDGVNGGLFTSKTNGNSIFVPAAGHCYNGSMYGVGKHCYLWSSSLCDVFPTDTSALHFGSVGVDFSRVYSRFWGFSVRGVANA